MLKEIKQFHNIFERKFRSCEGQLTYVFIGWPAEKSARSICASILGFLLSEMLSVLLQADKE